MHCLIPVEHSHTLPRSVATTLVEISQPLAGICVFTVFWLAINIRYSKSWVCLLKRCVLSALAVFYISYISICKTLVNILNCIGIHDSTVVWIDGTTDYWAVDTSIRCYRGAHAILVGLLAWPFLIIFTLGFPLTTAFLVIKNVTGDYKDGWIYDTAGFVYRSFSKRYIFWESVIMFRKTVLAVVVVFSYGLGSNIQAVLASFVLIIALYFQTTCRPYREDFDWLNDVESFSILLSSLTFVSSVFFGDDHVSHEVRVLISILLSSANLLFFFYLLTRFVIDVAEYLRLVLAKQGIRCSSSDSTVRIFGVYFLHFLFGDPKNVLMQRVHQSRAQSYRRCRV